MEEHFISQCSTGGTCNMKTESHPFFFFALVGTIFSESFFFSDGALINSFFFLHAKRSSTWRGVLNTDTDSAVGTRKCVLFYRALQPVSDGVSLIKYFDLIA